MNLPMEVFEEVASLVDGEYEPDYSGRSMFGATCPSIVHDVTDFRLAAAFAQAIANDSRCDAYDVADYLDRLADHVRDDSMGRSHVTYFPGVEVE